MSIDILSRAFGLKSLDQSERTCDFIASTDAVDSYEEVVEQDWDTTRFMKNPVILFGHQSRELPIGHATRCEVVTAKGGKKQLECTIKFATAEANPMAEQVWQSVIQGTLRAVSVGFCPGDVRFEKREGKGIYVLSKNELHEISVVPIPANPEALAKMRAKARHESEPVTALQTIHKGESAQEKADMTLEQALAKINELQTLNAEQSLKIKDETARADKAEKSVVELETWRKEYEEKALNERVALAFDTYKDARKLNDADKDAMLIVLRAKPETFERQYPKVAAEHAHLQRSLTEQREEQQHVANGETFVVRQGESFLQTTKRLMGERKCSYQAAQNFAIKLRNGQR